MTKRCVICEEDILEEFGKLKGTILKIKNDKRAVEFIYVCNECQKQPNFDEKAKIKAA
jgi:hypothetical protein